jgi:hypothetical protein
MTNQIKNFIEEGEKELNIIIAGIDKDECDEDIG